MIPRHPIPDVRRQQEPLLNPALYEVLRHTRTVINASDRTPLRNSLGYLNSVDCMDLPANAAGLEREEHHPGTPVALLLCKTMQR
jgi:hypothetical protein